MIFCLFFNEKCPWVSKFGPRGPRFGILYSQVWSSDPSLDPGSLGLVTRSLSKVTLFLGLVPLLISLVRLFIVNDEGLHIAISQRHTVDIFRQIDLFSTVTKTD